MTLEDVIRKLDAHIAASDSVHEDLAGHDEKVEARQVFIIEELFGPLRYDIDGESSRAGGRLDALESKVETLYSAQQNGGLNIHIPWAKLTGVLAAVVSAVGAIVVAVIGRL